MAQVRTNGNTWPIVEMLIAEQDAEGLNNSDFARKLGISPSMWTMARNQQTELGAKALRGIATYYPHIWDKMRKVYSWLS